MAQLNCGRRRRLIVILIIYTELLNQFALFLMNMCVLFLVDHLRRRTRRWVAWDHYSRTMVRNVNFEWIVYFDALGHVFCNDSVNGENIEDLTTAVEAMDKEASMDVDVETEIHIGEEVDEVVDSVAETQATTNICQDSGSNNGKRGKKRYREGSLIEMVADNIAKFSTLYETSASTIEILASTLKDEIDGANKRMLIYQGSGSNNGKRGKKRDREGSLIEMVVDSIAKFSTLCETNVNPIETLASTLKDELDGANKRILIYQKLKNIEGLNTLQKVKVGRLICEDSYTIDIFLQVDFEEKKLLVNDILTENQN